jgi:hypothetical protein
MVKVIVDKSGTVLSVEWAQRGVVRGPMSLHRFVAAVNEEFPGDIELEIFRGS